MPSGSPETRLFDPIRLPFRQEVFLVLHGLNLHPARMEAWRELLRREGFAVAQVALAGHDPADRRGWGRVSASLWLEDLERACAQARARWPGAALSLCGYSLGATLGLDWSLERGAPWRRALLIAPALAVRWYLAPLLWLSRFLLPGALPLPSLAPRAYRAHGTTPLAAFRALAALIARLEQGLERLPEFPQFVIYVEGDELISTRHLLHYRGRRGAGVLLHPLALPRFRRYPRHLAIDPTTLGEARWRRLTADVSAWLNAAPRSEPTEPNEPRGTMQGSEGP